MQLPGFLFKMYNDDENNSNNKYYSPYVYMRVYVLMCVCMSE